MRRITGRFLAIFLLVLVSPPGLLERRGLSQTSSLVIEGGTLIDGTGTAPKREAAIVIEGSKITAVGEKGKISYPQGARIIPASGKFILPGFIDMHVHWADWMPELFLAYGVTSAVDLASSDWTLLQREALWDGRMTGPRLFAAHGPFDGRLLWDRSNSIPVETAQMVRRLIREAGPGRAKYALSKAYTELALDELQAMVEESHKVGRNVIAHLGSLDARQAAEAGVDALAHASGVALATITDPVKTEELRAFEQLGMGVDFPLYLLYHAFMDPAKVDELVGLLVRKKVRIEPDLINTARWAAKRRQAWIAEDTKFMQDPNLHYIPLNAFERAIYSKPLERMDGQQRQQLQKGYENLQSFLRKFVRAGGTVLAACDTASYSIPGICFHRELELLVDAGLTPMQAIQAATASNAEFLQESELGTVEPGKLADLIIVREDPLADIKNTNTVDTVIKDGKVMDTRYHADFVNPIPRQRITDFPNPKPAIRVLYPITTKETNKEVNLTVEGTNLVDDSVVEIDGVAVPTMPVKSTLIRETMYHPVYTQVIATVPASVLNKFGNYTVIVKNPRPEGGVSNRLTFFVAP